MKKDDRGVSLVELLIAIVILAIIVTPFLNSFVTSARTNQKAKRIMWATSVAENIMEGMKAQSMEQIVLQLSCGGTPSHEPVSLLVPVYDTHQELLVDKNAGSAHYAAVLSGEEWQFVGQESNAYYFALTGIVQDGKRYDARIKLDASSYYQAEGETVPGYNDEELVQVDGLDLKKDVLYVLESSDEKAVCEEFAVRSSRYIVSGGTAKKAEEFAGVLTREITMEIKQSGTVQEVYLTLTYTAPVGWVAESERVYARSMQVFSSSSTGENLRNIYFLYPPNYNSISGAVKDIFLIKNYDKIECGVYLIKQVTGSGTELVSKEMFYRPRVEVMENIWGMGDDPSVLTLYNNFTTNLGKKEMGAGDYVMADQTEYQFNSYTGASALDKMEVKDILNKESSNRIFHAEVRIYEDGAFDVGTGTFDETKHIVTLEN